MNIKNLEEQEFLKNYKNNDKYEKASNTVDTALLKISKENKLQILMIKRAGFPFKNHWALVGGFMDMHETLEESAIREFKEETNLKLQYISQFKTYSKVNRDGRNRVLSTVFLAYSDLDEIVKPVAKDDALEARFLDIELVETPSNMYKQNHQDVPYIKRKITKTSYRLTLKDNNNIVGESEIIVENIRQGSTEKQNIIEKNSSIAFDHASILVEIMMYHKAKVSTEDFVFHLLPEKFEAELLMTVYNLFTDKLVGVDVVRNNYFMQGKLALDSEDKSNVTYMFNKYY